MCSPLPRGAEGHLLTRSSASPPVPRLKNWPKKITKPLTSFDLKYPNSVISFGRAAPALSPKLCHGRGFCQHGAAGQQGPLGLVGAAQFQQDMDIGQFDQIALGAAAAKAFGGGHDR